MHLNPFVLPAAILLATALAISLACGPGPIPSDFPTLMPTEPTPDLEATIQAVTAQIRAQRTGISPMRATQVPTATPTPTPTMPPEPTATTIPTATPEPEPKLIGITLASPPADTTHSESLAETGPALIRDAAGECQLLVTGYDTDRVNHDWYLREPKYGAEPSQAYWQPNTTGNTLRLVGNDHCEPHIGSRRPLAITQAEMDGWIAEGQRLLENTQTPASERPAYTPRAPPP